MITVFSYKLICLVSIFYCARMSLASYLFIAVLLHKKRAKKEKVLFTVSIKRFVYIVLDLKFLLPFHVTLGGQILAAKTLGIAFLWFFWH